MCVRMESVCHWVSAMGRMERSFADLEYETKKRKTWRERFLGRMDALIPWCKLLEEIKPY